MPGPAFGPYPERQGRHATAAQALADARHSRTAWGRLGAPAGPGTLQQPPPAAASKPLKTLSPEIFDGGWLGSKLGSELQTGFQALRAALLPGRDSRAFVARVRAAQARVPAVGSAAFAVQLRALRAELGLQGLVGPVLEQALGFVLAASRGVLGVQCFNTQLQAARILLSNRLAEMATGEGKTHAVMLAAATAALAGVPVHVITANPYLAARDAAALAPLYQTLGLTVAAVLPAQADEHRRQAWGADVAYTTARDLVFDYLRDRQRAEGAVPLLRGLCMALIDEADSVLLDEAATPFVLAEEAHDAPTLRRLRAALAAARRLQAGVHYTTQPAVCRAQLTAAGLQACPVDAGPGRDPLWAHDHHRRELVETALAALHLVHNQVHYLIQAGRVEIIDPTTGRITPGRRWSQGLHQLIELSQGLAPSPEQRTTAQLSFQRFFPRYWRLAGTSGTLSESRAELLRTYGLVVQSVPLRQPCQRRAGCWHLWADDHLRWAAVARAVAAAHGVGRPVLVGCDSLADADRLCAMLTTLGLRHQRLDARQDAHEAQCVARAGSLGAITVATRLAGRGTDIRLGLGVTELGGLLIIDAQANGSPRVDRQLHGRCARGGEPGEVLRHQSLQAPLFVQHLHPWLLAALRAVAALPPFRVGRAAALPGWLAAPLLSGLQRHVQAQQRRQRQALAQHDDQVSRQLGFGGRFE
jgi:preprotein translocase subunit SecA